MKIITQRKIDKILGIFICGLLSLIPKRKKINKKISYKKILIILLSEMGSILLAYPMFRYIKERYPDSSLSVAVFKRNRECLDIINMLSKGLIANVYSIDNQNFFRFFISSIRFLLKLRRERVDVAIDCELFSRIGSIYSFLSGAPIRVGFHPFTQEGLYRGDIINRKVLYNPYHHISKQFINLVYAMDSNGIPTVKRPIEKSLYTLPQIEIGYEKRTRLKARLLERYPQLTGKTLVLIYPSGGLLPIRAWPIENFCTLSLSLINRGYAVGIIGLREDRPLADTIKRYCKSDMCVDLTGFTRSILELLTLFNLSPLLITNDGGPGHFAALTPVHSIILFGPETPVLYGSLGKDCDHLHIPFSCSPCLTAYNHRNSPCDGNNLCLKSIDPERVLERALEILDKRKEVII